MLQFVLLYFFISFVTSIEFGMANPSKVTTFPILMDYLIDLKVEGYRMTSPSWEDCEPNSKGNFECSWFSDRITQTKQKNMNLVLSLGLSVPQWACKVGTEKVNHEGIRTCELNNINDFRDFCESFFTAYANDIHIVELSNEWTWTYDRDFSELVQYNNIFYDEAKKQNPNLFVSLGSVPMSTSRFIYMRQRGFNHDIDFVDSYIKDGRYYNCDGSLYEYQEEDLMPYVDSLNIVFNSSKYDAIDIHLYDDPSNWEIYEIIWREYLDQIGANGKIPIISTEFGGPHFECEDANDQCLQASRMVEYISTLRKTNLTEAYFFKLLEGSSVHYQSGLFKLKKGITNPSSPDDFEKKINYEVFKNCLKGEEFCIFNLTQCKLENFAKIQIPSLIILFLVVFFIL